MPLPTSSALRRRLAAGLVLLAAPLALGAPEPPEPPQATLTPAIDGDQFATRAAHLASEALEGRESGTPGGDEAEAYVAREMARFGLAPAGADGTPYQTVPLPWRPVLASRCSLEILREGEEPIRLTPFDGAVPFTTSQPGVVEAGVVFAGYGISSAEHGYDDWASLDATGKIAVVLRHGPREDRKESPWFLRQKDPARIQAMSFEQKAKRAAAAGAVAVLFVNDRHHKDDGLPTMNPGEPLPIPAFAVPRAVANRMLSSVGKELADFEAGIERDLTPRSCDLPGVAVRLEAVLGAPAARNVLFALPGTDPALRDEIVVISAHLDHVGRGWFGSAGGGRGEIHNGADDNASGTAALLEVAESLAAGPPVRRTVLFAGWCGEEKGLVGSHHWCEKPTRDLAQVVANVNLDMIGRYRDANAEDPALSVAGLPTGSGFTEKVEAAAKTEKLRVRPTWDAWEQSDHFSFYRKKIPVLFLHTGLHGDYHRPADDWWKLEARDAARIARFTADLARRLADDDARPVFKAKPPRAILGVALGESDRQPGALLMQVFPGHGAAQAGLAAGDVIVEFGGTRTPTSAVLSELLEARKPGEEVEVVYVRGGVEARAKLKLSGR